LKTPILKHCLFEHAARLCLSRINISAACIVMSTEVPMTFRLTLIPAVALGLIAQVPNEPNLAYKRYRAFAQDAAAPLAEVLKAGDEWLQSYERSGPGAQTIPPYLDLARFCAAKGVRTADIAPLLEKGVAEITNPGSFTQARTHGNSPFADDFQRAFAANLYIPLGRYEKARDLLAAVGGTLTRLNPSGLDSPSARISSALRFQYRDSMARLASAEGRKQDALDLERAILTEHDSVVAPRLIEEHRTKARQLWSDWGRPASAFDSWLHAAR
jgi:hypothetical protein